MVTRSRDEWRRVTVKPEGDPGQHDDETGRHVDMNERDREYERELAEE